MIITALMAILLMAMGASSIAGPRKIVKRTKWVNPSHVIKWHEYRTFDGHRIKHGPYVEKINGQIFLKGNYAHGCRDGRWVRWSRIGHYRKVAIITYERGVRVETIRPVYHKKYQKKRSYGKSARYSLSTLPHRIYHCP